MGVEGESLAFLSVALDMTGWLASCYGHFTFEGGAL
jgi:hypothetical protein